MGTALMAPRKKIKRNPAAEAVAKAILENYQPETVEDMQNAIKDIFGPMFESMLQGEMDSHLGYENNDHGCKTTDNRRNGYTDKTLKTTYGDVLFISMDGVSGLEEGARSIFKDAVVQRCIVHLIRNSIKYVPSKDYKAFTAHLKKVYRASSLKAAEAEFERFK